MADPSRRRYRRCDPSDEFESMMRWYWSYPGIECAFAPCDLLTPDYSMLERPQLNYYLWWRRRLSEGELLMADKGYIWLRVCELINMCDPAQGLREVAILKDHASELDVKEEDLDRVAADICISGGIRIPPARYAKDGTARGMFLSEALWDPSSLDMGCLSALVGEDMAGRIGSVPQGLDRFKGLLADLGTDEYVLGTETAIRDLFPRHVRFGNPRFMVTYDVFSEDLQRLLDDICHHIAGDGAPSRTFLERVSSGGARGRGTVGRTELGSTRVPVSKRDVDLMDMGTELFGEEPPTGRRGASSAPVEGPDGPLPGYEPSPSGCPDYRRLSDVQKRFYSLWSSKADSGRFHDADTGYVWMRLCSLVNSTEEPTSVAMRLLSMSRAYSGGIASALVRRTCMDYVLMNGLPIPDPSLADGEDEAGMVMEQYLGGHMEAKPDKDVLLRISGLLGSSVEADFDPGMAEVMRRTLMNVNSELLRSRRKGLASLCRKSVHSRRLYEGLAYYRSDRLDFRMEFADFAGDPGMKEAFARLATYITEESRRIASGLPRVSLELFGIHEEKLVEFLLTGSVADRRTWSMDPAKMDLDRDAIEQAESDLNDVTTMMRVEDDVEESPEEADEGHGSSDDPWEGFASGLDEGMKAYLLAARDGCRPATMTEKAINSLAMDTVGDIVVQDGEIVEDYLDDVIKAIGGAR